MKSGSIPFLPKILTRKKKRATSTCPIRPDFAASFGRDRLSRNPSRYWWLAVAPCRQPAWLTATRAARSSASTFRKSSLDHQRHLKEKHGSANLRLACLSLLDIETLGEKFDLIVSTGVLHHLPDPDAGLRQLKKVLLPHGVMSLMVYGWYRRFGVYMMQEIFRLLGVEQTKEGVELVRETIAALPALHHVKSFVRSTPDVEFDAGIVDLFLHPQDRAYSVPQVLQFAADNGLLFPGLARWPRLRADRPGSGVSGDLTRSPRRCPWKNSGIWRSFWASIWGRIAFCCAIPSAIRPEYQIDFSNNEAAAALADYVPQMRFPIDWLFAEDKWARLCRVRFIRERATPP